LKPIVAEKISRVERAEDSCQNGEKMTILGARPLDAVKWDG
jgi:hypothetical protein